MKITWFDAKKYGCRTYSGTYIGPAYELNKDDINEYCCAIGMSNNDVIKKFIIAITDKYIRHLSIFIEDNKYYYLTYTAHVGGDEWKSLNRIIQKYKKNITFI